VELANDINDHMPDYVVRRLVLALNRERKAVNGSRILLLGLAYKRNSGDARESPAMVIAHRLLALGAEVRAADPHVVEDVVDSRVVRVEASPQELSDADAVILLTDHECFDLDAARRHAQLVLDTRRRVEGERVEHL
jgi:UDP-N-acetyl-D-glucosamine dehydrogenase